MIKFDKPEKLNGEQLVAELNAAGVTVNTNTSPLIDGDENFWLDIPVKDKSKADPIVAAHVGIDMRPAKAAAKQAVLDKLGLTVEEITALLS